MRLLAHLHPVMQVRSGGAADRHCLGGAVETQRCVSPEVNKRRDAIRLLIL